MTRRRKTLLVAVALALLATGGLAWYWQATAADWQVKALLAEVREDGPGLVERSLIKLGLKEDRRTDRMPDEVADDLADLGPSAVLEHNFLDLVTLADLMIHMHREGNTA